MSNGFGPPPGQGFGPPPPQQPPPHGFGPPVAVGTPPVRINADAALFMGIAVALFCGCLPGGLFAILLADQAKKAAARGDLAEAQSKLQTSYILSAASVGIMVLLPCLYVAFMFLIGGAAALS